MGVAGVGGNREIRAEKKMGEGGERRRERRMDGRREREVGREKRMDRGMERDGERMSVKNG